MQAGFQDPKCKNLNVGWILSMKSTFKYIGNRTVVDSTPGRFPWEDYDNWEKTELKSFFCNKRVNELEEKKFMAFL